MDIYLHLRKSALPLTIAMLITQSSTVLGHGLMEDPPSRNWFCGVVTKPDHVLNGQAQYPICGDAFAFDQQAGYNFMSVLTHDYGRKFVSPLPENVCGFNSESFGNGETVWDATIDWPTTPFASGRQEIKWNIQWGPHFSDSEDFRYWITKPGFEFDQNRALTWNDFESTAFCDLPYDDSSPNANRDVIPLKDSAQFRTFCNVPERQGRHVIYGEWGRAESTKERFHGCMDVTFDGTQPPPTNPIEANISLTPAADTFVGAGSIALNAAGSTGSGLSYTWSVDAADQGLYSIDNPDQANATLTLQEPSAEQQVTVSLMIGNDSGTSTANASFNHQPVEVSQLTDLGQLTATAQTLELGSMVRLRAVSNEGVDVFYPFQALLITEDNNAAEAWTEALALAVNADTDDLIVGMLLDSETVNPVADATANRIYAPVGSDIANVFLIVEQPPEPPVPPQPPEPPVPPQPPEPPVPPQPPEPPVPPQPPEPPVPPQPPEPPVPPQPPEPPVPPQPPEPPVPPQPPEPPVPPQPPEPPVNSACSVEARSSNNAWYMGFDLATDADSVTLDFTGTGIVLGQNASLQSGVFGMRIEGQVLTVTKPDWVSSSNAGYFGILGNDNPAFANSTMPTCN